MLNYKRNIFTRGIYFFYNEQNEKKVILHKGLPLCNITFYLSC